MRHPSLVLLSHDHHHGLALALRCRKQGLGQIKPMGAEGLRERAKEVLEFYRANLAAHFNAEEQVLFPLMRQQVAGCGAMIDRLGPRTLVWFGGVLTGLAWVINSYATSLPGFYVGAVVGGLGVGAVYATCINNAIKWFPDKRGLAVGLTAAGYGSGTILTVIPIANMIAASGYQAAFFTFGLIQGAVIVVFASFLRGPLPGVIKYSAKVAQSRRDYTLGEALRTPVFWVMLAMFTGTVTGGLMAVAQLSVIAEDLGVRNYQVNFYFFTMAALPFALMMNTIVNGLSRPIFGGLSDHIGREQVMFLAFSLEAVGILALGWYGSNPWAFVILSGIVFFAWGEVYSLFSATAGDTFGTKNIGTIYGLLYCAKGIAALVVPFGNLLMEATGTWTTVLYTMAALDLSAALTAILILRPMRRRLAETDTARAA
jgi:oxalate/formate antiporter